MTICTAHRAAVLVNGLDDTVRRHVAELVERFPGVVVDRLVVMDDHIHVILLLDGTTPPLPRIVQALKSLTTLATPPERWPLWQRGYYDHVIRSEAELEEIREYVTNNPIAAQLGHEGG